MVVRLSWSTSKSGKPMWTRLKRSSMVTAMIDEWSLENAHPRQRLSYIGGRGTMAGYSKSPWQRQTRGIDLVFLSFFLFFLLLELRRNQEWKNRDEVHYPAAYSENYFFLYPFFAHKTNIYLALMKGECSSYLFFLGGNLFLSPCAHGATPMVQLLTHHLTSRNWKKVTISVVIGLDAE